MSLTTRGLALATACTGLLAGASIASAAPEVGRCVPVEGTGGFKGKSCRKSSPTHTGKYEWLPGAGEAPKFESVSEGPVLLETAAGTKIECVSSQTFGEVTGATSEKTNLYMAGCKEAGSKQPCTTETPVGEELPAEGTIRSQPLTGQLGLIEGAKKVGWDVKPETGSIVTTFECGAKLTGKQYALEGSLVDRVRGANRMLEETHEIYKQSGGKQRPEKIEGGEVDVLSAKFLSGLELVTEAIGFAAVEEHYSEEELEYRVSSS
jgi:hypothetical protein